MTPCNTCFGSGCRRCVHAPDVTSPAPPGMDRARWERLTRAARGMDAQFQYGAKVGVGICPKSLHRTGVLYSVGSAHEVLPAPLATAGELAHPDEPGVSK